MKRLVVLATAGAFLVIGTGAAQAAPQLETFGTGEVTVDGDSATIENTAGQFGGVYLKSKSQSGKFLADVDFSFTSTGGIAGGAPRFSIPIDDAAIDGPTDFFGGTDVAYAFIDVNNCGGPTVSTDNPNCQVFLNAGGQWANWDAFAAANPTYRIAPGYIPFVIADQPGLYAVTDIVLR